MKVKKTLGLLACGMRKWAGPALLCLATATAMAAPPRDRLTLLVPDDFDRSSWQVKVWRDSAEEEGIDLVLMTDSTFLALGDKAAASIAGLVVPDSAHIRASDAVVAAIKRYTYLGGHTMLVYDAGALDASGYFPLNGNSRFSDFVGVEYVLWNNGAGAGDMVGFGPVVGTQGRLKSLAFPPGKFMPYVPPASLSRVTYDTAFVPTSRFDPGGGQTMRDIVKKRGTQAIDDGSDGTRSTRTTSLRDVLGIGREETGAVRFGKRQARASNARDKHVTDKVRPVETDVEAVVDASLRSSVERSVLSADIVAKDSTLQTISGYGYGQLNYYHYVTVGEFPGTVLLSSPEHGLVAGRRGYGSGQLLFVNLPLGYFKAIGTDSVPLHGFMSHFARQQVGISTMSVQPSGIGGLIYNWHVDDGNDLTSNMKHLLDKSKVLHRGPFSIHFTAGPHVIKFGDGMGMDLNGNKKARDLVNEIAAQKPDRKPDHESKLPDHAIGSHGGWIHDYWGANANEANDPDLTPLLTQNFDAIERATGRTIREYSSPQGNTPLWAIRWLEQRGVVAMYLVGDSGNGMVRSWRDGSRVSGKLWTSPVTPFGKYATFEEFEEFGIPDVQSAQWLLDLQSFAVNKRTNRLFYTHPPGVVRHRNPIDALLDRADTLEKAKRFKWYTMTSLADFSQRRVETRWTTSVSGNVMKFEASHPTSVAELTRLLPKRTFDKPVLLTPDATVREDADEWIVTAEKGTTLRFQATMR